MCKKMFKKEQIQEIGSLDSIPINFGVLYELSIEADSNPTPITKKVEQKDIYGNIIGMKLMKLTNFENVKLHSFVMDKLISKKTESTLVAIDKSQVYNMELPKTLSNKLMEKINELGIKFKQKFYLRKIKTDNEFAPELEITTK